MKRIQLTAILTISVLAFLIPVAAEVVYTPVNVSIPVGSHYNLDLNHDGVPDFTVRSQILQDYCPNGNGYAWNLTITSATGDSVVARTGYFAAALEMGMPVNASQTFLPATAFLTELIWGNCGSGLYGQWINLPNRFLGFQFRVNGTGDIHYGWVNLSQVAYIDHRGHLHASTVLLGVAYETIADKEILAGQTNEQP